LIFGFVFRVVSAFSVPLCCLLSHARLLAGQRLCPCALAGAGAGTRCSPWAPGLGPARGLREQGLHLGCDPCPLGRSLLLSHPACPGSSSHHPTLPNISSQLKPRQRQSSSACTTDYAGVKSCSRTSQASYHSSSPPGWMGQSLWDEMLANLPT